MATEIPPSVFLVSGYHVPNARSEAESGNTDNHDIQFMYVGNIQNMKYLVERALKYDLGDVIHIPKFKDALESYIKSKWDFNDHMSMLKNWT